jgi:hypothetical protein
MIEALPANQSGADKTSIWHAQQAFLAVFKNAKGPFKP